MMHTELQQRIKNIHKYTASGGHQWRIVNDRSGKTYKPSKAKKVDTLYGSDFNCLKTHPHSFGSALDCFRELIRERSGLF